MSGDINERAYKTSQNVLNVGYAATIDCAVLVAAQELGLFRRHGLDVRLSREVGWTTIREKLLHEELDAAVTHASMLFSIYCGIGVVRRSCLSGLLLGRNGSAITLATEFWERGVRDAASLGKVIHELQGRRHFTFGVVQELSSQNFNLRKWLRSGGIDPDRDVRVGVIPSALMHGMLRAGHLDGYCVAEPWNSAAALDGSPSPRPVNLSAFARTLLFAFGILKKTGDFFLSAGCQELYFGAGSRIQNDQPIQFRTPV